MRTLGTWTRVALAACASALLTVAAHAAPIESIDIKNLEQTIQDSSKPVVLLVTTSNCNCATSLHLLEAAADNHPELRFITTNTDRSFIGIEQAPVLAISAPNNPAFTYVQSNFQLDNGAQVEAFLAERAQAVATIAAAKTHFDDIERQIAEKGEPFEPELVVLRARYSAIVAPFEARMEPIQKQLEEIYTQQRAATRSLREAHETATNHGAYVGAAHRWLSDMRLQQRLKPYANQRTAEIQALRDQLEAIQTEQNEALAVLNAESGDLGARQSAAIGTLFQDLEDARYALRKLVEAEVITGERAGRSKR